MLGVQAQGVERPGAREARGRPEPAPAGDDRHAKGPLRFRGRPKSSLALPPTAQVARAAAHVAKMTQRGPWVQPLQLDNCEFTTYQLDLIPS